MVLLQKVMYELIPGWISAGLSHDSTVQQVFTVVTLHHAEDVGQVRSHTLLSCVRSVNTYRWIIFCCWSQAAAADWRSSDGAGGRESRQQNVFRSGMEERWKMYVAMHMKMIQVHTFLWSSIEENHVGIDFTVSQTMQCKAVTIHQQGFLIKYILLFSKDALHWSKARVKAFIISDLYLI